MKDIIIYTLTFLALLVIMTIIGYNKEMSRIEALKQKAIEDSIRVADSLAKAKKDSIEKARLDSIRMATLKTTESNTQADISESKDKKEPSLNFKEVAKIYEKMKPAEAAKILNNFSPEEASGILLNMKKRQAAQIISNLEPSLAAKISRIMIQKGNSKN